MDPVKVKKLASATANLVRIATWWKDAKSLFRHP
jgi:hypothetical protein